MIGSPQDKPVPLPSRAVTGDGLVGSFMEAESSGGRLWGWGTGLAWAVSLLAMMVTAIILWLAGRPVAGIAVAGFVGLVVGLWCGVAVLRRTLSGSSPIIGVARAIVEEAISTRLSMVPLLLVLVSLPILPLLLDSTERLAYRIQFFLTWSLSIASVLLSVITIAVAASSVSGDIETRRIHMALAKPVRRWEYLFGKWLGVVLLDVLLVTLVGAGIYCFALSLARSQAVDVEDRIAVDEQVLTARASSRPEHPGGAEFDRSVEATIEEIRRDDPAAFERNPKRARKRILSQRVHEWHTVTADVVSSFMFKGLGPENVRSSIIQLRMEPFADNSSIARADVRFAIWLNERPYPVRDGVHEDYTFGTGTIHTIDIPAEAIAADGTLRLTIANRNLVMSGEDRPTSISFEPGEGLELLYRVDSFGSNVIRALLVLWAKLAMLAAAAIAAAAWLGFPTALLTGLMVYVTAAANAFFADAIDIYTGIDRSDDTLVAMIRLRLSMLLERVVRWEWWEAIKTLGSFVGDGFLSLVPSFGAYDSVRQLATGRVVPLSEVAAGVGFLAAVYPAVLLAIGWMLLERRDLVRSSS